MSLKNVAERLRSSSGTEPVNKRNIGQIQEMKNKKQTKHKLKKTTKQI